jgi:thiosulfate dehydrogenase
MRSSNAAGKLSPGAGGSKSAELISAHENEVLALSSYITWLSEGFPVGKKVAHRGENVIPADRLIPLAKLDAKRGGELYMEKCVTCHGKGGEGVEIGDKKAGPLWGSKSWNDGAGAARVYTLAGIIRYMMPYLDPGSLTDEEAQHIAAFINSKPRPKYPYKDKDYVNEKIPPDAVYYKHK